MSIAQILITGVAATVAMDLWAQFLKLVFRIPAPNWGFVGRWVAYLPKGRFIHRPIADTPEVGGERAIGWFFHYAVGVLYAAAYLALMILALSREPDLWSAILFSLATITAGWFILQPGLGVGAMARLSDNPGLVRVVGLSAHVVFGIGLYAGFEIATVLASG